MALALAAAPPAYAQVYTRKNANGVVEATNVPASRDFRLTYPGKGTVIHSQAYRMRPSYNGEFNHHIAAAAALHGVSVDLVRAVIQVESDFDHLARSSKGAQGLMQLMPDTARRFGVSNAYDPRQNIFGGVRYLRWLLDLFRGDVVLAAAGYNAGENAVLRYSGVPPYKETRGYVDKVQSLLGLTPTPLRVTAQAAAAFFAPDPGAPWRRPAAAKASPERAGAAPARKGKLQPAQAARLLQVVGRAGRPPRDPEPPVGGRRLQHDQGVGLAAKARACANLLPRAPFDQGLFLTHFNKGQSFYEERRYEDAERELEEAYLLRPRDQRVLNLLGLVYFKQEKLEKAEEVYRKLAAESPDAPTLFHNLGLIHFKLNRLEEAEAAFPKALELSGNNPKINFYLGNIYERLQRFQDAIYQYRQAGANLMVRRVEDKMAAAAPPPGRPRIVRRAEAQGRHRRVPQRATSARRSSSTRRTSASRSPRTRWCRRRTLEPVSDVLMAPQPGVGHRALPHSSPAPPATPASAGRPAALPGGDRYAGGDRPGGAARGLRRSPRPRRATDVFRFLENNLMEINVTRQGLHQAGHDLLLRRQPDLLGQGPAAGRTSRAGHDHRPGQDHPHRPGPRRSPSCASRTRRCTSSPTTCWPARRRSRRATPPWTTRTGRRVPGARGQRHGGAVGGQQAVAPGGHTRPAGVGAGRVGHLLDRETSCPTSSRIATSSR